MNKIMFNERYGLQKAVFEGKKTQTRREPFFSDVEIETHFDMETGKFFVIEKETREVIHTSRYAVGEIVAIAQSYKDAGIEPDESIGCRDYVQNIYSPIFAGESKGWKNKMFVQADLMPHHIRIAYIRCERLQDITYDDCLKEGVYKRVKTHPRQEWESEYTFGEGKYHAQSPRAAFAALICKLNGKKFWDTYQYVIVYEFEKID